MNDPERDREQGDARPAPETRTIRLDVQYLGTRYAGWQIQPARPTVQGCIEEAFARVVAHPVRVHGSGRTDAGAHARGQVAHAELADGPEPDQLARALNHYLPWDIRITGAREAPQGFHARGSAVSKEYRYRFLPGRTMPPHLHDVTLLIRGALDRDAMRAVADSYLGTHDFAQFRALGSSAETTVRSVIVSELIEDGDELSYRVAANGFLYKMVRAMAGAIVAVGQGRCHPDAVRRHLVDPSGPREWRILPPRGLHLWQVQYPVGMFPN